MTQEPKTIVCTVTVAGRKLTAPVGGTTFASIFNQAVTKYLCEALSCKPESTTFKVARSSFDSNVLVELSDYSFKRMKSLYAEVRGGTASPAEKQEHQLYHNFMEDRKSHDHQRKT
jgi:hypothetical protein